MDEASSFGQWLQRRRRSRLLTQAQLADQAACSTIAIRKIEADERRPSPEIAEQLARVLGIDETQRPAFVQFARGEVGRFVPDEQPLPLRRLPARAPGNLPLERTSFVGRERELAVAHTLLAANRLVTLTGTGGTGKTRLALRLAAARRDVFPDGIWVVNLATLHEPALVPQAVATALGIREAGSQALEDTLLAWLRERHLLLVLDSCEHLVKACARLVDAVLPRAPSLRILVTSREPLNTAGEVTFVVPPLGVPHPDAALAIDDAVLVPADVTRSESVHLFVERAAAVRAGFALAPGQIAPVAHICRRLDGLPLAIELAAARVRVLTVEQIAERLDDRFRLLTGGPSTSLARQQTLQASIDWSYELLTGAEQTLLCRLAPFVGGWTLEAAEAVCGDSDLPAAGVLDVLTRLVDSSLVVMTDQQAVARYRLLESIRQYALEKLHASGASDPVWRRHAAYALSLAQVSHDPLPAWKHRIETELDNLRAALRWTLEQHEVELAALLAEAVGWFWYRHGYWREGRSWLAQVLALLDDAQHAAIRAQLLFYDGLIAQFQGDSPTARVVFEQSLALFRQLGDTQGMLQPLFNLGILEREAGDIARATALFGEAVARADLHADHLYVGWLQLALGEVAVMQDDGDQATRLLTSGLATFQEHADPLGTAWALNHLAHVAQLEGRYTRAAELHEQSLPLFGDTDRGGLGWAHAGLGDAALGSGKLADATRHFGESLRIFGELGDSAITWSLAGLASVAVLRDDAARAARLWGAVEALRERTNRRATPAARATYERTLGLARARLGQTTLAAAWSEGRQLSLEQAIALATGDA